MSNWKKVFAIIWTGQLFSTLGSAIVGYAVVFWLSLETRSAEVLALATIATLLPQLVLGTFTGVLIDRWDRRRTMIAADLFIAVCSAKMGVLFDIRSFRNSTCYWLLDLCFIDPLWGNFNVDLFMCIYGCVANHHPSGGFGSGIFHLWKHHLVTFHDWLAADWLYCRQDWRPQRIPDFRCHDCAVGYRFIFRSGHHANES